MSAKQVEEYRAVQAYPYDGTVWHVEARTVATGPRTNPETGAPEIHTIEGDWLAQPMPSSPKKCGTLDEAKAYAAELRQLAGLTETDWAAAKARAEADAVEL